MSCSKADRRMVLLSSASDHPVEGALVYAPGELTVYRSDVHGQVDLPAAYGPNGIRVFAKNHRTADLDPEQVTGEVVLEFDESLMRWFAARYQ